MADKSNRKENTFRTKSTPDVVPMQEQLIDTEEKKKEEKQKKGSSKKDDKSPKKEEQKNIKTGRGKPSFLQITQ